MSAGRSLLDGGSRPASERHDGAADDRYTSRFGNWDTRASVRMKPRRRLGATDADEPLFFPPEFVPAASHPLVAERPDVRRLLLVHSLYQYLHFTTVLEHAAVMPVTMRIVSGQAGTAFPEAVRADGFKITTDEAWHAQFCHEFLAETARVTGVRPTALVQPAFVGRLVAAKAAVEPSAHALVELFFAVVSETLVSSLLADIPKDRRLPPAVRAVVGDHAEDEGRHHAYFRDVLRLLWPRLSDAERRLVGVRVPDFARAFLLPDHASVAAILRTIGLGERAVASVVDESYREGVVDLRPAARGTVRAFRDVGALDDEAVHAAFRAGDLLDPA